VGALEEALTQATGEKIMRIGPSLFASLLVGAALACAHEPSASTATAGACPDAVKQAITAAFPDAAMTSCKAEHEDGRDQFEVKLNTGHEKMEVDVLPDGKILQTEQPVRLDEVPAKVITAFAAKYPGAKPTRVEKQVRTGKGTYYELAFPAEPRAKEATFAEGGTFVEEE
jgi:hypothetical protein